MFGGINMERRPYVSKFLGGDYQSFIALEYMLEMLKDPSSIEWITLEYTEGRHLDDVVVKYPDRIQCIQAKYTVEPDQWTLEDLLEADGKKLSLLEKWAYSWHDLRASGMPFGITVRTRREIKGDLETAIQDGRFRNDLWDRADLISVKSAIFSALSRSRRGKPTLTEDEIREFLADLRFELSDPDVETILQRLRADFISLGGGKEGWDSLHLELRQWSRYSKKPEPDGRIRIGDVRRAALLWSPEDKLLPEDFPGDQRVCILDWKLKAEITEEIARQPSGLIILEGTPGSGKSSFLSWLSGAKTPDTTYSFRHHCFLELGDPTYQSRIDPEAAAEALLAQIWYAARDALDSPENPAPHDLSKWLRELAQQAHNKDGHVLLVIDGLDHIYRERELKDVQRLLTWLPAPIPPGLWVILGTQPLRRLLPRQLEAQLTRKITMRGFSEEAQSAYLSAYGIEDHEEDIRREVALKSDGNPLYLRYLVESFPEKHILYSKISRLPSFGGSIKTYYAALWETLASEAKVLLCLLAWAGFNLPKDDLASLLKRLAPDALLRALEQVRHLLDQALLSEGNLRFYHPSLSDFIRNQEEANTLRQEALEALLEWLNTRADTETHWGYGWEVELHLGNPEPLLEGLTRDWAVRALADQRPLYRARELLRLGIRAAAERKHLRKLFQIGWVLEYVNSLLDYTGEDALTLMLRVKVRSGIAQSALLNRLRLMQLRLDPTALCDISRACDGYKEVNSWVFDQFSRDNSKADMPETYRAAAYSRLEPHRVLRHYRSHLVAAPQAGSSTVGRDSVSVWQEFFRAYLCGLMETGQEAVLRQLMDENNLGDGDLEAIHDNLLRLWVRRRDIQALRSWLAGARVIYNPSCHLDIEGVEDKN